MLLRLQDRRSAALLLPSPANETLGEIHVANSYLIPLARARAGAALGHGSLVFDRCPTGPGCAPRRLLFTQSHPLLQPGPSNCDIAHRLMAPRPPRCRSKTAIDVSRPRDQTNVTAAAFVGAARQTHEACCRAQPSRCSLATIRWRRHTGGVLTSRSGPRCQVIESRAAVQASRKPLILARLR